MYVIRMNKNVNSGYEGLNMQIEGPEQHEESSFYRYKSKANKLLMAIE